MQIEIQKKIGFFEVNQRFELRLRGMLNYLQEAAGVHSEQAGHGSRVLMEQGNAWILHRLAMEIHRPPVFGDMLRIITWHKGQKGFRAYRDFELSCGGEKIGSAASLWLFIDLQRKKILKIPRDVQDRYSVEDRHALRMDIDAWKPDLALQPETVTTIQTRPSDYDPLGHVNNALYFDYLETMTERVVPHAAGIQAVRIQFNKEIQQDVSLVEAGMKRTGEGFRFCLSSPGSVHAAGEVRFTGREASIHQPADPRDIPIEEVTHDDSGTI